MRCVTSFVVLCILMFLVVNNVKGNTINFLIIFLYIRSYANIDYSYQTLKFFVYQYSLVKYLSVVF